MPYNFGDIVLVKCPFKNQAMFKQRPAVVISTLSYNNANPDVIVMAITSQTERQGAFGESWIIEWKTAGLLKPSVIKPVIATMEQSLLLRALGRLQQVDA